MKEANPELVKKVQQDIADGMSIQDVIKKYGITEYFARKWTNLVYKDMDIDTYVRRRYKWIAVKARTELESALGDVMNDDESESITDETWEKWDAVIKHQLYEFAKDIIAAN